MLKNLFLIFIITACPVFASCPVDIEGGACVAEFQSTSIQDIVPPESKPAVKSRQKEFLGIKDTYTSEREIQPTKNLRSFGPNNSDYGYNSSCQFGVCSNTGTPKNFPIGTNQ